MDDWAFVHFHTTSLPVESNDIGIACITAIPFNLEKGDRTFHVRLKVDKESGDEKTLQWYGDQEITPLLEGIVGPKGAWEMCAAYLSDQRIRRVFTFQPEVFRYKMHTVGRAIKPWQVVNIHSYLLGQGRDPVWPKWTTDHQSDCYVYTQYLKDPKLKDPTQLTLPEVFKAEEVSKKSKKKSKKKGKKK